MQILIIEIDGSVKDLTAAIEARIKANGAAEPPSPISRQNSLKKATNPNKFNSIVRATVAQVNAKSERSHQPSRPIVIQRPKSTEYIPQPSQQSPYIGVSYSGVRGDTVKTPQVSKVNQPQESRPNNSLDSLSKPVPAAKLSVKDHIRSIEDRFPKSKPIEEPQIEKITTPTKQVDASELSFKERRAMFNK